MTGEALKQQGIQLAIDNADSKINGWSQTAYDFLTWYAQHNDVFLIEDVREASKGRVPMPPNNRSWGSVTVKAQRMGLIEFVETKKVSNPTAHSCFASVWRSLIVKEVQMGMF